MSRLRDDWGSYEVWLRALCVWAQVMWLFREEFPALCHDELTWLPSILAEAKAVTKAGSARFNSYESCYAHVLGQVRSDLERRLGEHGNDAELLRLRKIVAAGRSRDPLHYIFVRLKNDTAKVYKTSQRKVELGLGYLDNHPIGEPRPGVFVDQYHIDAQTKVIGDCACVELMANFDNFDEISLLAVPAILTHELVCHAYAHEDRNNDKSMWAEGVMDWTALHFFRRWVLRTDVPYQLANEHGDALWVARMSRARYNGRWAADSLVKWLVQDRSVRALSVAQEVTASFAVQHNAAYAPLVFKDALAARLMNIQVDKELQGQVLAWRHRALSAADLLAWIAR